MSTRIWAHGMLAISVATTGCQQAPGVSAQPPGTTRLPLMGPETEVSAPVPVASGQMGRGAATAWSGDISLTVFVDADQGQLFGQLRRVDGSRLQPASFPVPLHSIQSETPEVASAGSVFLVVWTRGTGGGNTSTDIMAARVDTSGALLDPDGFPIAADPTEYEREPQVLFDGARFLVAWRQSTTEGFFARHVGMDGIPEDAPYSLVPTPWPLRLSNGAIPAVVWSVGDDAGVTFGLHASVLTPQGAVATPAGQGVSGFSDFPGAHGWLASSPGALLASWQEGIFSTTVHARPVLLDGGLGADNILGMSQQGNATAAAWNGREFQVAWRDFSTNGRGLHTVRVDPNGVPVPGGPPGGRLLTTAFGDFSVAPGPGLSTLTFDDGNGNVRVMDLLADGGPPAPPVVPISTVANSQQNPAAFFDGEFYWLVWQDSQRGWPQIVARRFDVGGLAVDPQVMELSPGSLPQSWPAVAFNGSTVLVAWQEGDALAEIRFVRASPAGVVLDTPSVLASGAVGQGNRPAVAAEPGADFLLVWEGYSAFPSHIVGHRVHADGVLAEATPFAVSPSSNTGETRAAVAFDGTQFVVSFTDVAGSGLVRVARDGLVTSRTPLFDQGDDRPAVIASGGDRLLIVQVVGPRVEGVIWTAAAQVAVPAFVLSGFPANTHAAAFDGHRFQVIFDANLSGVNALHSRRVTLDGLVSVQDDIVSVRALVTRGTALASSGDSRLLLAHTEDERGPGLLHAYRVYSRLLENGAATGAACVQNNDCQSLVCAMLICAPPVVGLDAGRQDAAMVDGNAHDAGVMDANAQDAAAVADAATPDSSAVQAGDAGATDADVTHADAAPSEDTANTQPSNPRGAGCGCTVPSDGAARGSTPWMSLLGMWLGFRTLKRVGRR